MKSILVFAVIVILCFSQFLHGQYNYDKYRFPDLKVQGLNLSFNSDGYYNKSTTFGDNISQRFGFNFGGDYFRLLNNDHKQITDNLKVDANFDYAKEFDTGSNNVTQKRLNTKIDKSQINRRYLKNETTLFRFKGKFYEINHRIYLSNYKQVQNTTNAFVNLSVGFGFGRLEPVSEIFDAQFLMNNLLDSRMIQTKFSENELFELAALMANVKNQRVFDFRRANIYQLTELSKWLDNKGIPQNIKTFTILNDNWTGNFIAQRLQGKRLTFLVSPWADQRWSSQNSSQLYRGGSASVNYIAAKNKSLYIGTEMKLKLSHSIVSEFPNANNVTTLSGGYSWIFNPNSRTTISASTTLALATQKFDNYAAQVSIPMSLNYFINNRARISGNLSVNWLTNDNSIFERQNELREFNPNFQSEASNQNLFNSSFSSSHFNISGRLNFFYTLF